MTAETRAVVPLYTALDVDEAQARRTTDLVFKHKGSGIFPSDMTEAQAAAIARLAVAYRLDPFADDLIIYQGKPYLTLKGAMRLANQHPQYDGLECNPATPDEREAFRARDDEELWVARVWRKDRRLPNVGYGRASKSEPNQPIAQKWPQEMAQKRAKHRALRDAFSLPVPGAEESRDEPSDREPLAPIIEGVAREAVLREAAASVALDHDPRAQTLTWEPGEEPAAPPPIRNDQVAAIHAIGHALGWITKDDDTLYREALARTFHVVTSKDLTENQAAAFIEAMVVEQQDAMAEERPARPPGEVRRLIALMDDGEHPNWPNRAAPSTLARLRARAKEIGMTDLQLAGLIAAHHGEGVGLELLDERQALALLALLSTGELTDDDPLGLGLLS